MEQPKPVSPGAPGPGRPDRPLGRGLEDVSRVFLSPEREEQVPDAGTIRRAVRPLPRDDSARNTVLLRAAAQIDRVQLAEALRDFEGALEEGLRIIDCDIPCGPCGEIDLLAVDRASRLAIIDFETASSDELLIRGLGHVDWVAGSLPNLRRMWRGYPINFSLPSRLLLLAPGFSPRLRCAARQVAGLQVDWVRYHLVQAPDRLGILFERVLVAESPSAGV
jgi:hypothetical protein